VGTGALVLDVGRNEISLQILHGNGNKAVGTRGNEIKNPFPCTFSG
jgi:hypothetical protein